MRLLSRLDDERKSGAIWYAIFRQSPYCYVSTAVTPWIDFRQPTPPDWRSAPRFVGKIAGYHHQDVSWRQNSAKIHRLDLNIPYRFAGKMLPAR
jgi:hypothetical protein